MYTKRLTDILLVFLSIFCLISCNHDDVDFPTFTFNENGECEPASLTPISSARFEEAVVGYGWKHVHTYEINPDGTCQTQDYYTDLIGAGPTQYYVESHSSLKAYMYVDAYPASGFRTYTYTYSDENRLLDGQRTVFQLLSVNGDTMELLVHLGVRAGGTDIYGYSIYQRMTAQELEEVQKTYHTDLSDVRELTVSVQENPLIISGKETEFDVLSSNGPFIFKPAREGSCKITSQGNHVKVKLLSNGVCLTGYDRLRHCQVVIFSTDEELEPKGTDIYDFTYTEITVNQEKQLFTPDGHEISYDLSSMKVTPRKEYTGSILSQYAPVALLAVDENGQARYLRMNSGKISFKNLLPQEVLDQLTEGTDGTSLTYKLELITPDCEVFQVLPFKVTYKKIV